MAMGPKPVATWLTLGLALGGVGGRLARTAWPQESDAYARFNAFCAEHFGAEREEEMYRAFGEELAVVADSSWRHVSETSACVAWQTSLPAKSWVECGTTAAYGLQTPPPERHFSLHLHHLRSLRPETTYHYRLVSVDERGRRLLGPDQTLRTRRATQAIRVPGDLDGPPYVLDQQGATYLVTQDVAADGTAIFLAASGITLDLGGHTITYDQTRDTSEEGACGVRGHKSRGIGLAGLTVLNGTIRRGQGGSTTRKLWDTLYSPLFFSRPSRLEIAGVRVEYDGDQVVALALILRGDAVELHHNSFLDRGTSLLNRHVGLDAIALGSANSRCHHNLIRRTRHRGINPLPSNQVDANEIYIDSYATNSYGIMYYAPKGAQGLRIHHNRIFGTGYHPVGIGSGQGYSDVTLRANYIQMQGTPPQGRWTGGQGGGDAAGQLHPVNGIRLQKPGRNVLHADNVVVAKGSGEGCLMRCLWLVPGAQSGPGLVFRNNRLKLLAQDRQAEGYAISAGGTPEPGRDATVRLEGNTIVTNLCHVQFGDNYSHGGRHVFSGNRFVRVGDDPRYRTIRFGWRGWKYESYGHVFIDSAFEGGAGHDSVSFDGAQRARYDFAVGWTLEIRTTAGAAVTVRDGTGAEVCTGRAGEDGRIAVPLTGYVRTRAGREPRTPHSVTVEHGGKRVERQVTMDSMRSIEIGF
jgi:hypothetical protein